MGLREPRNRLAMWRKHRGITQVALAKHLGVHEMTIRNWESGNTVPTRGQVEAIAKLFRCPVRELFPRDVPRERA